MTSTAQRPRKRCVALVAGALFAAMLVSYLFTYWLAEQRSPVLPSGLISLIVESFLGFFCKTRTKNNLDFNIGTFRPEREK